MVCVYIAGKMSSTDPIEFLRNLDRLQTATAELRDMGFAPFPVADDFADIMRTRTVNMAGIKAAGLAWLRRADCVFVTPNWRDSEGTIAEIMEAGAAGIPVFFNLNDLWAFRYKMEDNPKEAAHA